MAKDIRVQQLLGCKQGLERRVAKKVFAFPTPEANTCRLGPEKMFTVGVRVTLVAPDWNSGVPGHDAELSILGALNVAACPQEFLQWGSISDQSSITICG